MNNILTLIMLVYFFPLGIAFIRNHPSFIGIAILNVVFGFTVLGWILALIWAVRPYTCQNGEEKHF